MKKCRWHWGLIMIALVTLLAANAGCMKIVMPDETAQPSGGLPGQTAQPSGFTPYTDATNGFSISYPQDWEPMPQEFMTEDSVIGFRTLGTTPAAFYVEKSQLAPGGNLQTAYAELKQVAEASPGYSFISRDDITVNGIPAFKYIFQRSYDGTPAALVYAYLVHGGVEWTIQLSCAPVQSYTQYQPTFDSIIGSFQIFNR